MGLLVWLMLLHKHNYIAGWCYLFFVALLRGECERGVFGCQKSRLVAITINTDPGVLAESYAFKVPNS